MSLCRTSIASELTWRDPRKTARRSYALPVLVSKLYILTTLDLNQICLDSQGVAEEEVVDLLADL
jgi:hypothetical protein